MFDLDGSTTACHCFAVLSHSTQDLSGLGLQVGNSWSGVFWSASSEEPFQYTEPVSLITLVSGLRAITSSSYRQSWLAGMSPPFHAAVATFPAGVLPLGVLKSKDPLMSWPVLASVTF